MNETLTLLKSHRSIRTFKPDPIPDEHIRRAIKAGQAASTSSAIQSYCAIRVSDEAKREALVELTGGQPYVAAAAAFFVICGDTRRHRLICERAGKYDTRFEAFLLASIDASLFAQNTAVAFESMGYGICFIGGLRLHLDRVDELLGIPHGIFPLFGLCVGVADQAPSERPRLPLEAVLHEDRYVDDGVVLDAISSYDETYRDYLRERGAAQEKIDAAWSGVISDKFGSPRREHVAPYYASKGADLS